MNRSTINPQTIHYQGIDLQLLPEKAIYSDRLQSLILSDVHLGKPETFQQFGIPIPNTTNQATLERLRNLCLQLQPKQLFVLGDLFHSRLALTEPILKDWRNFQQEIRQFFGTTFTLIVGNHDRSLVQELEEWGIPCCEQAIALDSLQLSHEPASCPDALNLCGHIHPCVRLKSRLDDLRLPCFYWDQSQNQLILPSFGEFTGGYEMPFRKGAIAYVVAEGAVIPWQR